MDVAAPTHVIVDHINAGGTSGWWAVWGQTLIGAIPATLIAGAISAGIALLVVHLTLEGARTDKIEHRRIEDANAVATATSRLLLALNSVDNRLAAEARVNFVRASGTIEIRYGKRWPNFEQWRADETRWITKFPDDLTTVPQDDRQSMARRIATTQAVFMLFGDTPDEMERQAVSGQLSKLREVSQLPPSS